MESRAKMLGHPIHPMLVVLPLGLFIGAVVFDAVALWRGSAAMAQVGFWNIAGGIVGGVLAAVFGLVDWLAIPSGTPAKRIGLLHAASNVAAIACLPRCGGCATTPRRRLRRPACSASRSSPCCWARPAAGLAVNLSTA